MLAVREQPRIVKLLHLRVLFEERGHLAPRRVVLLHSDGERLRPPQHKPRVEGREYRADAVLYELKPFRVLLIIKHNHTADAVRMSVQILRRRMDDDVNAELNRSLKVRRHESVVAHDA